MGKTRGQPRKYNRIDIDGDIAKIHLNGKNGSGKIALIDTDDVDLVKNNSWHLQYYGKKRSHTIQAVATAIKLDSGKQKMKQLHRVILNATDPKIFIDHINGNVLDNRRSNLRFATNHENSYNRHHLKRKKSSVFKGVTFYKPTEKWRAAITVDKKLKHLGYFVNEIDAAIEYDLAARKYHGDFACTNKDLGLLD